MSCLVIYKVEQIVYFLNGTRVNLLSYKQGLHFRAICFFREGAKHQES